MATPATAPHANLLRSVARKKQLCSIYHLLVPLALPAVYIKFLDIASVACLFVTTCAWISCFGKTPKLCGLSSRPSSAVVKRLASSQFVASLLPFMLQNCTVRSFFHVINIFCLIWAQCEMRKTRGPENVFGRLRIVAEVTLCAVSPSPSVNYRF